MMVQLNLQEVSVTGPSCGAGLAAARRPERKLKGLRYYHSSIRHQYTKDRTPKEGETMSCKSPAGWSSVGRPKSSRQFGDPY